MSHFAGRLIGRRGDDRQPASTAAGGREDDVEAVALGPDLGSRMACDDRPNEFAVGRQQLGRGMVAVTLDERGVPAQVAATEAMRAGR